MKELRVKVWFSLLIISFIWLFLGRKTRTWYAAGEIIGEEVVVELYIQKRLYILSFFN